MTAGTGRGSRVALLVGVLLASLFGVRAVLGVVGGVSYAVGQEAAADGDYINALPLLERAVPGHDPASLHWLRGQVRQGLMRRISDELARNPRSDRLLREAFADYCRAIAASPASGWYWANLAEIYQEVEEIDSVEFPLPLELAAVDGPVWIGYPGRVAIGLSRLAVEREPGSFVLYDTVAETLFENGLDAAGLEAVEASARVQPIYYLHPYRYMNPILPGLLDAFARGSRSVLDATPLLRRGVHLVALGRLEARRENWSQAIEDLTAALDEPGHDLDRAEAWYWLGYSLGELGRDGEAIVALERSREHPNMETRALESLAALAERRGDLSEAAGLMRELHAHDRRNLKWILDYARLAKRAGLDDAAEDTLRWGIIVHPEEARFRAELVTLFTERGRLAEARRQLTELERFEDAAELAVFLREQIEAAGVGNTRDLPGS